MNHLGTKTLETKRLILRPFAMGDDQAMFDNWSNDPRVTEFLRWQTHRDINDSREILREWTEQYHKPDYYQWAITLKDEGEAPIGGIGTVEQSDALRMVHIGYCIGRRWWRRGITSEAFSAVIDFFLREVGVNRIESRHDPENPNSGGVMKKCGLKYEGTHRQADLNNRGVCDVSVYAVLREDFLPGGVAVG
ncbi:MAG: GNAT family N-acetyltransferase [Oscillospiraceae bacterium]|jgi:ribosomal-protein-alanine N-acetyltransferase|nr:GNAT family N-acetyltransferase [Oscillospiraceae bacterium]